MIACAACAPHRRTFHLSEGTLRVPHGAPRRKHETREERRRLVRGYDRSDCSRSRSCSEKTNKQTKKKQSRLIYGIHMRARIPCRVCAKRKIENSVNTKCVPHRSNGHRPLAGRVAFSHTVAASPENSLGIYLAEELTRTHTQTREGSHTCAAKNNRIQIFKWSSVADSRSSRSAFSLSLFRFPRRATVLFRAR